MNAEFFYHEKLTTPHTHTFYDEDCNKYEDITILEEEVREKPAKRPEAPWIDATDGPSCGYEKAMLLRLAYLMTFFVYFTGMCCF